MAIDPKLHDFLGFAEISSDFVATRRHSEVRRCSEVFRSNTQRAHQLAVCMIAVAHYSGQEQLRRCMARSALGLASNDLSQDNTPAFARAYEAASSEWLERRRKLGDPGVNIEVQTDGIELLDLLVQTGLQMEDRGAVGGTWAPSGVRGLLGAVIMMNYAAFESLATDLWELALNSDPSLAANWLEKNNDKQIKLSEFAGQNFDLSKSMGSFLLRSNKVSFTSLNSITQAYEHAFGSSAKVCFQPWKELHVTEQVRHLLAHRGGLTDAKFLKTVSAEPAYASLTEGVLLPITGELTRRHSDSCVLRAIDLIEYVDTRIG